jgi:hypothetical protein
MILVEVIGNGTIYVQPQTDSPNIYVEITGIIYQNNVGEGSGPVSTKKMPVLITSSTSALLGHVTKVIKLSAPTEPVVYTIDPDLLEGETIDVICINSDEYKVSVAPLTGTINGQSEIEFGTMDAAAIWSDGTNLFLLK